MKKITLNIDDKKTLTKILNSQEFKDAEIVAIKGKSEAGIIAVFNSKDFESVRVLDLSKTCFLVTRRYFENVMHQLKVMEGLRDIILPDDMEVLKTASLHFFYNLQNLTLPKNLKKIEHHAIETPNLKKLILPDSVEVIEGAAFSHCEKLTEINIPKNVKQLESPFDWCHKVKEIILSPKNKNFKMIDGALFSSDGKRLICVPPALCEKYEVPWGTEVLESGCFESFVGKSIVVSESVKTIKHGAIDNCPNLETVVIPDSVVEMKRYSIMRSCISKHVRLSESIVKIDESFFFNCGGLKSITLPEKLEYIKSGVLSTLFELDEIKLSPANPNYSVYDGALYTKDMKRLVDVPCNKVEKLKLYEGVEIASAGLFWDQTGLKEFTFPDSVKVVETRFFDRCRNLKKITFGKNIEEIAFDAFHDCDMLKTFVVPTDNPPKVIKVERDSHSTIAFWCEFDFNRMTVFVPKNAVEKYRAADYWKDADIKPLD